MLNIIDYVKKYGDLDYETMPFNDVDRLILSQFSYFKFDGFLPEVGENKPYITIGQLSKMPGIDAIFADERYAKNNRALFEEMACHNRFSFIRINYYINIVDEDWEIQFSALTALLPNGAMHVVFRGTDDSIIGWKEDLNMGFLTPIPAQEKALDYINYVSSRAEGDFSIGGHSKGGNLSVYSAMMSDEEVRDRITGVYSYDGPGFSEKILAGADFERIKSKVHKLVPHSSIVGMLLMSQEEYEVVACKNFGILQHDPFNWIVEGDDFVKRDEVKKHMQFRNETVNAWARNLSEDEFRLLSDRIYDVFIAAGIDDLNDIYKNPKDSIMNITKSLADVPENERKIIWDVFKELIECFIDQAQDRLGKLAADELDRINKIKASFLD